MHSDDPTLYIIILLVISGLCLCLGACLGACLGMIDTDEKWEQKLIEHDCGYYDPKTGNFRMGHDN